MKENKRTKNTTKLWFARYEICAGEKHLQGTYVQDCKNRRGELSAVIVRSVYEADKKQLVKKQRVTIKKFVPRLTLNSLPRYVYAASAEISSDTRS